MAMHVRFQRDPLTRGEARSTPPTVKANDGFRRHNHSL